MTNNSRTCLAIDLDDCMAALAPVAAVVLSEHTGVQLSHEDWWTNDWTEMYQIDMGRLRELIVQHIDYSKLQIIAPDFWHLVIGQARARGVKVLFVTARANVLGHEKAHQVTYDWLKAHGFELEASDVVTTTMSMRKAEVLQQLGWDVVASIDDYVREVEDYKRVFPKGRHSLIATPINQCKAQTDPEWPHEMTDLNDITARYVLKTEILLHLSSSI